MPDQQYWDLFKMMGTPQFLFPILVQRREDPCVQFLSMFKEIELRATFTPVFSQKFCDSIHFKLKSVQALLVSICKDISEANGVVFNEVRRMGNDLSNALDNEMEKWKNPLQYSQTMNNTKKILTH